MLGAFEHEELIDEIVVSVALIMPVSRQTKKDWDETRENKLRSLET